MKILVNRRKVLFDGDQEDLFHSKYNLKCLDCSSPVPLPITELKSCSQLSSCDIDVILSSIKGVTSVRLGSDVFLKVNDVPLKYVSLDCPSCGSSHLGFFGMGEYQPNRFMLFQVASGIR